MFIKACQLNDMSFFYCIKGVFLSKDKHKGGVTFNCEYCGKEVWQPKTQYNRGKHHYCSNKCQKMAYSKANREIRKCEFCNKEFETTKCNSKRFCCVECQHEWQKTITGKLNPRCTCIDKKCGWCGKEILVKKYKIDKFQHLFCSIECKREWYGNVFSQTDEWKEESKIRAVKILSRGCISTDTKPQLLINSLLDNMYVKYENEKNFKYYAMDNYLPEYNLIIEVMGDYWHCSPLKYTPDSMNDVHKKRIKQDKAKRTYTKKYYGIDILYLWEHDINNNIELCRLLIKRYIDNKGKLSNYNSFNYHITNGKLIKNRKIILPYFEGVNVVGA